MKSTNQQSSSCLGLGYGHVPFLPLLFPLGSQPTFCQYERLPLGARESFLCPDSHGSLLERRLGQVIKWSGCSQPCLQNLDGQNHVAVHRGVRHGIVRCFGVLFDFGVPQLLVGPKPAADILEELVAFHKTVAKLIERSGHVVGLHIGPVHHQQNLLPQGLLVPCDALQCVCRPRRHLAHHFPHFLASGIERVATTPNKLVQLVEAYLTATIQVELLEHLIDDEKASPIPESRAQCSEELQAVD